VPIPYPTTNAPATGTATAALGPVKTAAVTPPANKPALTSFTRDDPTGGAYFDCSAPIGDNVGGAMPTKGVAGLDGAGTAGAVGGSSNVLIS
jgi:hypothetical protein